MALIEKQEAADSALVMAANSMDTRDDAVERHLVMAGESFTVAAPGDAVGQ
jgi:hypothetical protein